MNRLKQPSTWAGLGLILQAIGALIASKGTDAQAWAALAGGVGAVVLNEKGAT